MSSLALLGLQLLYVQFYDVYVIQFVSFVVIALGQMPRQWPRWCKAFTAILCLITLTVSALWSRSNLEKAQAQEV